MWTLIIRLEGRSDIWIKLCNLYQIQDLHAAMKMLGLNPMEQEIIDLTNNIVRNGYIYFPEFCEVILKKFREEDEDVFNQNMFKVGVSSFAPNNNTGNSVRADNWWLHF